MDDFKKGLEDDFDNNLEDDFNIDVENYLYGEVYKVNATEAYMNGAYDEYGNAIHCSLCWEEMKWDPEARDYYCPNCYTRMSRAKWFDHIDADPPGKKCLSKCRENYPLCKNWCPFYKIPDDDPIL